MSRKEKGGEIRNSGKETSAEIGERRKVRIEDRERRVEKEETSKKYKGETEAVGRERAKGSLFFYFLYLSTLSYARLILQLRFIFTLPRIF